MISNHRPLLISSALMIIGGLGWFLNEQFQDPGDSTVHSSISRLNQPVTIPGDDKLADQYSLLAQQFQQMQAQQLILDQKQSTLKQTMGELTAALESISRIAVSVPPTASNNQSETLDIQSVEEKEQEIILGYEEELLNQDADQAWSSVAESQISTSLSSEVFSGSSLINQECRSTFCRMEVTHENQGAMENFIDEFPTALAWNSSGYVKIVDESDGRITTVVYQSRDGHPLPGEASNE